MCLSLDRQVNKFIFILDHCLLSLFLLLNITSHWGREGSLASHPITSCQEASILRKMLRWTITQRAVHAEMGVLSHQTEVTLGPELRGNAQSRERTRPTVLNLGWFYVSISESSSSQLRGPWVLCKRLSLCPGQPHIGTGASYPGLVGRKSTPFSEEPH